MLEPRHRVGRMRRQWAGRMQKQRAGRMQVHRAGMMQDRVGRMVALAGEPVWSEEPQEL